mgnify:CR=1 FL=1
MSVCVYICVYVCMYTCVHVCEHVCTHAHSCAHACALVCLCLREERFQWCRSVIVDEAGGTPALNNQEVQM